MAKRNRHQSKEVQKYSESLISDSKEIESKLTLGAKDSPYSIINYNNYLMPGSTSTSNIRDDDDDVDANEGWALANRLVQGDIRPSPRIIYLLVTLAWFVFCSWQYSVDNQLGRLETLEGIKWFFTKTSAYSIFFAIALFFIAISSIIRNKPSTKGA